MSENEEFKPMIFSTNIPPNIPPGASGDCVRDEIKQKHHITISASTVQAINVLAEEGAKEKMKIQQVDLQLGADWLPIKINLKWERKK